MEKINNIVLIDDPINSMELNLKAFKNSKKFIEYVLSKRPVQKTNRLIIIQGKLNEIKY